MLRGVRIIWLFLLFASILLVTPINAQEDAREDINVQDYYDLDILWVCLLEENKIAVGNVEIDENDFYQDIRGNKYNTVYISSLPGISWSRDLDLRLYIIENEICDNVVFLHSGYGVHAVNASDETINNLIEALGSEEWDRRERATRHLRDYKFHSRKLIQENTGHNDPEVAHRCRSILRAQESTKDEGFFGIVWTMFDERSGNKSIIISHVVAETIAAELGLQKNDRITSINGKPLDDLKRIDTQRIFKGLRNGLTFRIEVLEVRDGHIRMRHLTGRMGGFPRSSVFMEDW